MKTEMSKVISTSCPATSLHKKYVHWSNLFSFGLFNQTSYFLPDRVLQVHKDTSATHFTDFTGSEKKLVSITPPRDSACVLTKIILFFSRIRGLGCLRSGCSTVVVPPRDTRLCLDAYARPTKNLFWGFSRKCGRKKLPLRLREISLRDLGIIFDVRFCTLEMSGF